MNLKEDVLQGFYEHFGPYVSDEVHEQYAEAVVRWLGANNLAVISIDKIVSVKLDGENPIVYNILTKGK